MERAEEVPLLIKTTEACYPTLQDFIRTQHPYETPEIVAFPLTHGLPDYLGWVVAETAASAG